MKGKAFKTVREGRGNFVCVDLGVGVRVILLFFLCCLVEGRVIPLLYFCVSLFLLFGRIDSVFYYCFIWCMRVQTPIPRVIVPVITGHKSLTGDCSH